MRISRRVSTLDGAALGFAAAYLRSGDLSRTRAAQKKHLTRWRFSPSHVHAPIPRTLLSPGTAGRELTFTHAHARGEDNCCGVIRHDGDERRTHTHVRRRRAPPFAPRPRRCNNPYRHGWLPLLGLHNRALIDNLYGACRFI